MGDSQVRALARRLAVLERQVLLRKQPSLAHSSIDDGALLATDEDGETTLVIGTQHDGTNTTSVLRGPTPPQPTIPFVTTLPGGVRVYWDGTFTNGDVAPMDFARVLVYAVPSADFVGPNPLDQTRIIGQFTSATGGEITAGLDTVEHAIYFVAWTEAGKYGAASDVELGTPTSVVMSHVLEYAVNTSETVAPTTGWSTDTPTRTPGSFIWQRVTVTRHDGTTATTSPALLTGNTGETGSQGVPGPAGADGTSLYTWIKYADSPTTGMSDSPTGKAYLGIAYNKTSPTESTVYTDYAWSLVEGPQGDQGVPGPPGEDGAPTYTWIKYGTSAAGAGLSDDPTGKTYIGIAYNKATATESTNAADYAWSLIQGPQGEPGDQGIPGPPGADGQSLYTWLKYADTPTSGMSDSPTGKAYIGLAYNKTSSTESANYADYAWSLIEGPQGDQGVPGPAGADGQTTYTWVKYGTSSTGAGLSDDPAGKTYIGLAYNKTTPTESTNAADYTWSLIQGPQGPAGSNGVSVTSVTPYFAQLAKTASAPAKPGNVATPPSPWVASEPAYAANTNLWRTDRVGYSNGTYAYTTVVNSSAYAAAALAIADALKAQQTADGKAVTYFQNEAPTGLTSADAGDLWFDTNDGNKVYRWGLDGSTWKWIVSQDQSLAEAVKDYVASMSYNLIPNGTGLLGDNTNFTSFTYEGSDAPTGAKGSFKQTSGGYRFVTADRFIPVDPTKVYEYSFAHRQVAGDPHRFYGLLQPFDAYNHSIAPYHYMEQANTRTTLAAALNPGDTTITLTSAAGWNNGATGHQRSIIFWDYVDQGGKLWAPGTYSRNSYLDIYNQGGISGNVITLKAPWAGPAKPAGTVVGNSQSGGSYMYVTAAAALGSTTWTNYTGRTVKGIHTNLTTSASTQFPAGTANIKVGWLISYQTSTGTTASTGSFQAVANVSLNEVTVGADAQATADRKITTFYQDNTPSATAVGDLWVDTNDGYKLYRANSIGTGGWVSVQDQGIQQALNLAASKSAVYRQPMAPWPDGDTSHLADVGDMWIDTKNGPGPLMDVVSVAVSGTTATLKTEVEHGLAVGNTISLTGHMVSDLTGQLVGEDILGSGVVATVPAPGTFTFTVSGAAALAETPVTGGIVQGLDVTPSNRPHIWADDDTVTPRNPHWINVQDSGAEAALTLQSDVKTTQIDVRTLQVTAADAYSRAYAADGRVAISDYEPGPNDVFQLDGFGNPILDIEGNPIPKNNGSLWITRTRDRINEAVNPSFETSTSFWTAYGSTMTRVAAEVAGDGGYAARVTNDATTSEHQAYLTSNIPVTAGEEIIASGYMRSVSGTTGNHRVKLVWYNGSTVLRQDYGDKVVVYTEAGDPDGLGGWRRAYVTGKAPEGTVTGVRVSFLDTAASAVWELDSVLVERSSRLGRYFDGDSEGGSYTGTPHLSSSELDGGAIIRLFNLEDGSWTEKFWTADTISSVDVKVLRANKDYKRPAGIGDAFDGALIADRTIPVDKLYAPTVTVGEAVTAGQLVNIYASGGSHFIRPARALAGFEAHGFVLQSGSVGAKVGVYSDGYNPLRSGLEPGNYFLSSTPGAISKTVPTTAGSIVQRVGYSANGTTLNFTAGTAVTIG